MEVDARRIAQSVLLAVLLLAPGLTAGASGHAALAMPLVLGTILSLQTTVLARPVSWAAFFLALPMAATAILPEALQAAFMCLVVAACAISSVYGLHGGLMPLALMSIFGSYARPESHLLETSVVVTAAGAYGWAIGTFLLKKVRIELDPSSWKDAVVYSLVLTPMVLVSWALARLLELPHPWWMPMIVLFVMEPRGQGVRNRAVRKVTGTILGVMVGVGLASVLPDPKFRVLAAFLFVVMALTNLSKPFWMAVFIAPLGIMLAREDKTGVVAMERAGATIVGCTFVYVAALLVERLAWLLSSTEAEDVSLQK